MKRIGVLLLAASRALYCWMFLILSLFGVESIYHMRSRLRAPALLLVAYYVVFGIAWWMIFRRKPALKKWAIAANSILIFFWWPPLLDWNWRLFLENERRWWPVILIGTFGIIIFSIPYHGWRHRTPVPANRIFVIEGQ